MNFLAHSYIAARYDGEAAVALGAMLPDFFGMAGVRGARPTHAGLETGVRLHHRTDEAFHSAPTFVSLASRAGDRLESLGVGRGPARAAAHVGIELLLDGVILPRPGVAEGYRAALALAPIAALGRHIEFRAEEHGERYERLVRRLIEIGLPEGFAGPETVAERLERTLRHRPRLALDSGALALVRAWLVDAHVEVHAAGDRLVGEVTDALERE